MENQMIDPEEQTEPTRRHEEADVSPEDEEIFDEVWRKIQEQGWDNMPDGF
jgi:hypothetical protein